MDKKELKRLAEQAYKQADKTEDKENNHSVFLDLLDSVVGERTAKMCAGVYCDKEKFYKLREEIQIKKVKKYLANCHIAILAYLHKRMPDEEWDKINTVIEICEEINRKRDKIYLVDIAETKIFSKEIRAETPKQAREKALKEFENNKDFELIGTETFLINMR